jgi:chemotaxis signal transduction protein
MTTTQTRLATSGLFQASVGKYVVALSATQILGIERAERIKTDESTGAPILINRQGEYQIYNLGDLLNVPVDTKQNEGQVLLLESGGVNIGLRVDRVAAIPRHPAPRLVEASLSVGHVRVKQVVLLDGGAALPWVDLGQLFHPTDEDLESPELPRRHSTRRSTRLVLIGSTIQQKREVAFGLSAGVVTEIVDVAKVTPLAGASANVLGLIEWRGQAVQLLDLATYCGSPTRTPNHPRVVVVNLGDGKRVAYATGGTVKAVDLSDDHTIRPDWLGWPNENVRGVFEFEDLTVVVPVLSSR